MTDTNASGGSHGSGSGKDTPASILEAVSNVYKGHSQFIALKGILAAMITGEPILLIGSHGTFKSSMASLMGRIFEKPIAVTSTDAKSFGDIERFFEDLGKTLHLNPDSLMQNRVDGVDVLYRDYPGYTRVNVTVDLIKHPNGRVGEARMVPISVFSRQISDQIDPEDILGYGVQHRAILGDKPPHVVKEGKLAGADLVILDEAFTSPRLLNKLHTAMNEKVVETTVGPVKISPLCFIFCTNPWSQHYQTNIKVVNVATLDRFLMSVATDPPSGAEILNVVDTLASLQICRGASVETIYEARKKMDQVEVPSDILRFCIGFVAALSTCYFSPSSTAVAKTPMNPFMVDKDCALCRYRNSVCAIANIGKVRSLVSLRKVMIASAIIRGANTVNDTDLDFALRTVLPHRLAFNDTTFVGTSGTIHNATVALVNRYIDEMEKYAPHLEKIMALPANPSWQQVESLMNAVSDSTSLRAILDDLVQMMKEKCEKKGERIPDAFAEHINASKAISTFTSKTTGTH